MEEELKSELLQLFKTLKEKAFACNHYDLEEKFPEYDAETWKVFLLEPEIKSWVDSENAIIRRSEINKATQGISTARSVGTAQAINALQKLDENSSTKNGPAYIYTFVPLDDQQIKAENVRILSEDPFLKNVD